MLATYLRRSDLSQINLISQMPVAHPILVSVRTSFPASARLDQVPQIAFDLHLDIDANPPIERCAGAVDINVGNPYFDDLGYFLSGLLVVGNAYFGYRSRVARIDLVSNRCWERQGASLSHLIEGVVLICMNICHFYTRRWLRIQESLVEENVERAVLCLYVG